MVEEQSLDNKSLPWRRGGGTVARSLGTVVLVSWYHGRENDFFAIAQCLSFSAARVGASTQSLTLLSRYRTTEHIQKGQHKGLKLMGGNIDSLLKTKAYIKYSGVPNSRVVFNKHVGWTSEPESIHVWSPISMWWESFF